MTPADQARYDVLVAELARESATAARLHAELHAALVETRKLREALGLAHYAPPKPARNFGGG